MEFLSSGPTRPGPTLVLDFGHATTNLVVYDGYARQRVRTLPVGGLRVYRRFFAEYLNPRWGPSTGTSNSRSSTAWRLRGASRT